MLRRVVHYFLRSPFVLLSFHRFRLWLGIAPAVDVLFRLFHKRGCCITTASASFWNISGVPFDIGSYTNELQTAPVIAISLLTSPCSVSECVCGFCWIYLFIFEMRYHMHSCWLNFSFSTLLIFQTYGNFSVYVPYFMHKNFLLHLMFAAVDHTFTVKKFTVTRRQSSPKIFSSADFVSCRVHCRRVIISRASKFQSRYLFYSLTFSDALLRLKTMWFK